MKYTAFVWEQSFIKQNRISISCEFETMDSCFLFAVAITPQWGSLHCPDGDWSMFEYWSMDRIFILRISKREEHPENKGSVGGNYELR